MMSFMPRRCPLESRVTIPILLSWSSCVRRDRVVGGLARRDPERLAEGDRIALPFLRRIDDLIEGLAAGDHSGDGEHRRLQLERGRLDRLEVRLDLARGALDRLLQLLDCGLRARAVTGDDYFCGQLIGHRAVLLA